MNPEPTIADVLARLDRFEDGVARHLATIDLELRAIRAQLTLLEAGFTAALADHVERGHDE
jgi:hypothetical protein